MNPYFNTSGPCVVGRHYLLPPERRLGRVMELIEQGRYLTLHAGRQTGKTTSARWLVEHYNQGQAYHAVWVDVETAREQPDESKAMREILMELERSFRRDLSALTLPSSAEIQGFLISPASAMLEYLTRVCQQSPRPLIILFDEVDGLVGPAMVSFLTQLRRGYMDRDKVSTPHSLALIGMRQVRDYILTTEERRTLSWLGTTSPFNITAEASTLAPFTRDEVVELLGQHTQATGQVFHAAAAQRIFDLSQGHPWLVNALADQMTRDVRDRGVPLTSAQVEAAKDTLILERRTHIDSLMAKLHEPRVRRIVQPMLLGASIGGDSIDDDLQYVAGLGLIRLESGRWEIANPIYREVVPRTLTFSAQTSLLQETAWYVQGNGELDLEQLLRAFQTFWRKDGHLAAEGFTYREAGPHLLLMAFLQRIVNGGGRVEREYGLGRGALDLLIEWKGQRHVIEVKLRRDTETEQDALDQVSRYLDHLDLSEGWLVLFDLRKDVSWDQKLTLRDTTHRGKQIRILGC